MEGTSFETIDKHALSAPASAANSVESLATYLAKPAHSDVEKARAVFTWVAENIAYDVQGYARGEYGDVSASGVLASGASVCAGYSALFEALGKAAGLQVVTISGWAKGVRYAAGDKITGATNHAWNAVKIDNGWYLIDSTWAAGSMNSSMQFVKEFDPSYFFMPPGQFIYRHFPENPNWQLLDPPVSKTYFENLPYVWSGFFTNHLQLTSHQECVIECDDSVSVLVGAPSDVLLSATLDREGARIEDTLAFVQRREDNRHQVDAVFPTPGSYALRIYARKETDASNSYDCVLEYKVLVSQGMTGPLGFPDTYKSFQERDVYLMTPMVGHLNYGSTYTFKLRAPNALGVAVIAGNQWYHLVDYGDYFQGSFNVTFRGELGVYAKYPDSGDKYQGLLGYICE